MKQNNFMYQPIATKTINEGNNSLQNKQEGIVMKKESIFKIIKSTKNGTNLRMTKTKVLDYIKTDPDTGKKLKDDNGKYVKSFYTKETEMSVRIGVDYSKIQTVIDARAAKADQDPVTGQGLPWGHWYRRNGLDSCNWTGYVIEHSPGLSSSQKTYVAACKKIITEIVGDIELQDATPDQKAKIRQQLVEIPKPETNWRLYLRVTKPSNKNSKPKSCYYDPNGNDVSYDEVASKVAPSKLASEPNDVYDIGFDDIINLEQPAKKANAKKDSK